MTYANYSHFMRTKKMQFPTESIYNLISNSPEIRKRPPIYKSKHNASTKQFYESIKKPHQTMGYAHTPLRRPDEFLKKHTRQILSPNKETQPFSCLDEQHKKPPVPKRGEAPPLFDEGADKDFVRLNKLNALRKPAVRPERKTVDTKMGDSFFLEFSGLVPKFSMKKEFGEMPKYLVQRKRDLENSDELYRKSLVERKLIKMSEEERIDLLEGLQANWAQLHKRYLSLPLFIDTRLKKVRKLELEAILDRLEHDIHFLKRNEDNDIFVLPG